MAPAPINVIDKGRYLLVEVLPQAGIVVATLCEADHTSLSEYASQCCPGCAVQECLLQAFANELIEEDERVQVRQLNPNDDDE